MNENKTVDQKINELNPGYSVEISRVNNIFVTAERSGDGSKVRFVRHDGNTSRVFRVAAFFGA